MKHESDSVVRYQREPARLSRFGDWSNDGDVGGYRIGDGRQRRARGTSVAGVAGE